MNKNSWKLIKIFGFDLLFSIKMTKYLQTGVQPVWFHSTSSVERLNYISKFLKKSLSKWTSGWVENTRFRWREVRDMQKEEEKSTDFQSDSRGTRRRKWFLNFVQILAIAELTFPPAEAQLVCSLILRLAASPSSLWEQQHNPKSWESNQVHTEEQSPEAVTRWRDERSEVWVADAARNKTRTASFLKQSNFLLQWQNVFTPWSSRMTAQHMQHHLQLKHTRACSKTHQI